MIAPGPATRIFLSPGPTDLRRSFDGLHGLVQSQLAEDPPARGLNSCQNALADSLLTMQAIHRFD